jgi:YbbR domain-containing protein
MNKLLIKISSIALGFSLWYTYKQSHYDSMSLDVPIYFYNETPGTIIKSPETIQVTLAGTRKNLNMLDKEQLAIHLDASRYSKPMSYTIIDNQNLFLPATIKLIHYCPAPIPVEVLSQANQS